MPTIISAILGIIGNVIGGVTEEQKAKLALQLQANQDLTDLLLAQAKIDENEANSPNIWVAGARPFIMWVCGCAFAWQYLIQPIITYFFILSGHSLPLMPVIDSAVMTNVLMGMLGLGAMRSWEKYQGVNGNHN